jgi:hypothetical protein
MIAAPPSYTLSGFSARVKMSKDFHLFIVVEGPETDPRFYSEIARSSRVGAVRAAKVFPVELITRKRGAPPGTSGSTGKRAVIDAFRELSSKGKLRQENLTGVRSVVFCVDRDLDTLHSANEGQPHFIVTKQRDAEAEIVRNANDVIAFGQLLSLDHSDALSLSRALGGWREDLARIWKYWIEFNAVAVSLPSAPPGIPWAGPSLINAGTYGLVDIAKRSSFEAKLLAHSNSKSQFVATRTASRAHIRTLKKLHGPTAVLKGKWYPHYLHHLLSAQKTIRAVKTASVRTGSLLAFDGALDYSEPWADSYRSIFESAVL